MWVSAALLWLLFRGIPWLIAPVVLTGVTLVLTTLWFSKPFAVDLGLLIGELSGHELPPLDWLFFAGYSISVLAVLDAVRREFAAVDRALRRFRATLTGTVFLAASIVLLPLIFVWLATPIGFPLKLWDEFRPKGERSALSNDTIALLLLTLSLAGLAEACRHDATEADDPDDFGAAPIREHLSAIAREPRVWPESTNDAFATLLQAHCRLGEVADAYRAAGGEPGPLREFLEEWGAGPRVLRCDPPMEPFREALDRILPLLDAPNRAAVLTLDYLEQAAEHHRCVFSDQTRAVPVEGGTATFVPLRRIVGALAQRDMYTRLQNSVVRTWPFMHFLLGEHPARSITGRYLEYSKAAKDGRPAPQFYASEVELDAIAISLLRERPNPLPLVLHGQLMLLEDPAQRATFIQAVSRTLAFTRTRFQLGVLNHALHRSTLRRRPVTLPSVTPDSAAERFNESLSLLNWIASNVQRVNDHCFANADSLLFRDSDGNLPHYWKWVRHRLPVLYRGTPDDLIRILRLKDFVPKHRHQGLIPPNPNAARFDHATWFVAGALTVIARRRLVSISKPTGMKAAGLREIWKRMRDDGPIAFLDMVHHAYDEQRYASVQPGTVERAYTAEAHVEAAVNTSSSVVRWWFRMRLRALTRQKPRNIATLIALGVATFRGARWEDIPDAEECFWLARARAEALLRESSQAQHHDHARRFLGVCDYWLYRARARRGGRMSLEIGADAYWRAFSVLANDLREVDERGSPAGVLLYAPMHYKARLWLLRTDAAKRPGDRLVAEDVRALADETRLLTWFAARTPGYADLLPRAEEIAKAAAALEERLTAGG